MYFKNQISRFRIVAKVPFFGMFTDDVSCCRMLSTCHAHDSKLSDLLSKMTGNCDVGQWTKTQNTKFSEILSASISKEFSCMYSLNEFFLIFGDVFFHFLQNIMIIRVIDTFWISSIQHHGLIRAFINKTIFTFINWNFCTCQCNC